MKTIYLLDTNIISYLTDPNSPHRNKIKDKLLSLSEDDIVSVSIITLYELSYGLNTFYGTSEHKYIFEDGIKFIREYLDIYPLDINEIDIFGILKSKYKQSTGITKTAIKKNDLDFLIAATAISHNAILISNDTIFNKIIEIAPEIEYENWV
jgi:predicted nucleic acid-binding protein